MSATYQHKFEPSLYYLLDHVFVLDSDSPLHQALHHERFSCPEDFCMMSFEEFNALTYPGIDGTLLTIPSEYADLLKAFKQFVSYQNTHGWIVSPGHWFEFTFEHFKDFVSRHSTIVFHLPIPTPPVLSPLHTTIAMQATTVCPLSVNVLSADSSPQLSVITLDSQQVYPPMPAKACLQNSCWGSQQEIKSFNQELQPIFLTATSNPEDIPNDNSSQPSTHDHITLLSEVHPTDYVQKLIVCPSTINIFVEDALSYAEYLHSKVIEEPNHHMEAFDNINCSLLNHHDATAQVCDIKTTSAHVLTTQMSEIIPRPSRTFILAPNGNIRPSRVPMVTYTKSYISPCLLDLHNSTHLLHSCWGNQQESFLDAIPRLEDISAADNALIPLAMELDALLHSYGEPIIDEMEIVFESTADCTTNALFPTFEESEACHIASISPETCKCAHPDHLSKPTVYIDGETTLDALAMELDSLLYSVHGEYALDEVTIELDPIFASVDDAIYDIASIDTLAFELDSMFDILAFEADLPFELENQSIMDFKFDADCSTSFATPTSLPTASEASKIEVLSPTGTGVKPRLPPSPNLMVLDIPSLSEVTKELQMSFQKNRKILNFDKDISVSSSTLNVPEVYFADGQLPQKHLVKKQYLPPEGEQKISLLVLGYQANDTDHSIGKPDQPTAPPYCHTPFWHQRVPYAGRRAPSYATEDRTSHSSHHGHSIYKPWGEKKGFTAHIGWENGESSNVKFLDDSYKLPP